MEQGPFGKLIVAEVVKKILASYGTCMLNYCRSFEVLTSDFVEDKSYGILHRADW
jgi:hypothetical protein